MKIILHTKEDKDWYWKNQANIPDAAIIIDAIGKKHKSKGE